MTDEEENFIRWCWDGTPCDQGQLPCEECDWVIDGNPDDEY